MTKLQTLPTRDTVTRKDLGAFIAAARENTDLSQADFAREIGVSASQVSRWERGINVPTTRNLKAIVAFFALSSNDAKRAYELYALATAEDAEEKLAAVRGEMTGMKQELRVALDALIHAADALAVLNQFVVTYEAFHAAYQKMGTQVDQLVEEVAEIKQAVLGRPRRQARP